ncbi:hypothetical protein J2S51_001602 [Streptomyces sp. DSM 41269]|nr:hypothetical protein [Streptomyces sp. DSM 41269]
MRRLTDQEGQKLQQIVRRGSTSSVRYRRWSIRELAACLRRVHGRVIRIGRKALRCLLARRVVTFQRTKTRKESPDPTAIPSSTGSSMCWSGFPTGSLRSTSSDRSASGPLPAPVGLGPVTPNGIPRPTTAPTASGTSTVDSIGDDTLWGVNRRKKGADSTLAALKSIRAARPDGAPIYVILDNLSAHKGETIRRWAKNKRVELCFTPTYASWANPIKAHFGPLRQFTVANSNHRNHIVLTRALHAYLRWRNTNARHPDLLAAQRKECARIRSEKALRWGGRLAKAA